jgi:hypothetical protein
MGDKTVKTVKVDQSKAEDWEEYAEGNPEVDSVSHLIRLSVQKEISGKYDIEQRVEVSQSNDSIGANGEVLTRLRKLQTGISDIEERMSALEDTEDAESRYDFQKVVFELLPTPPEDSGPGEKVGEWNYYQVEEYATTAEDLATRIKAKTEDVRSELDTLYEQTGQVGRTSVVPESEKGGVDWDEPEAHNPEQVTYYWRENR